MIVRHTKPAQPKDPLRTKDWVKELVGKPAMTAHEIAQAREAAGDGKTYGPDVVTRLKNSKGIRVIPVDVPGKARSKKYVIELE